ncbi:MAG: hypothetical protein KBF88_07265, partial [Polyangiaceae bacterium]|nr:hypothetical protein [Polyangiaceae bacterium]
LYLDLRAYIRGEGASFEFRLFVDRIARSEARTLLEMGHACGETSRRDLRAWMIATDVTASRAGFLLCQNLKEAYESRFRFEAAESATMKDWLDEMLRFALSDGYLDLRRALELSVDRAKG